VRSAADAAEYDKAHGNHGPQKLIRNAEGIMLAGYTVKDGRQAAAPAKKKPASTKAKANKATAAATA